MTSVRDCLYAIVTDDYDYLKDNMFHLREPAGAWLALLTYHQAFQASYAMCKWIVGLFREHPMVQALLGELPPPDDLETETPEQIVGQYLARMGYYGISHSRLTEMTFNHGHGGTLERLVGVYLLFQLPLPLPLLRAVGGNSLFRPIYPAKHMIRAISEGQTMHWLRPHHGTIEACEVYDREMMEELQAVGECRTSLSRQAVLLGALECLHTGGERWLEGVINQSTSWETHRYALQAFCVCRGNWAWVTPANGGEPVVVFWPNEQNQPDLDHLSTYIGAWSTHFGGVAPTLPLANEHLLTHARWRVAVESRRPKRV